MLDSEMNDILMVLAVGVLADMKVHPNETQILVRAVTRFNLSNLDLTEITEAKVLVWFKMNKRIIRKNIEGPSSNFDDWFVPILQRVGTHVDKGVFLNLLQEIFLADHELHLSETSMMKLVKRVWA